MAVNENLAGEAALYNSNRVARSVESKTRIELSEARMQIEKLQSYIKELQSMLQKYTLTAK